MALKQKGYRKQIELFRTVSENAADMIALVDVNGKRLYNSPAYERVLGYSAQELAETGSLEQIHPDDREKVKEAGAQAKRFGIGKRLEYRMRHKDGTWRVLESTASIIRDEQGLVKQLVIVNRDITERKQMEEQLEHNAFHDALTDLPNRNLFLDRLGRASEYAKRHPDFKFAVLFVHIQGLKIVNETMGHAVVDQLITDISKRLKNQLRHDDMVTRTKPMGLVGPEGGDETLARIDGEQFTILLEGIKEPSGPLRVAMRVQESLVAPFIADGVEVYTQPSIGIAMSTTSLHTPAEMLRDADIAMCRAKALGGSGCAVFDEEMHALGVKRLKCESELRKALTKDQLVVFYQPIVEMTTGLIRGCEALVRWKHPERGLLGPKEFIDVAEETGLIVPIGRWILREACRQATVWQGLFPSDPALTITVNVSQRQFVQGDVVADVKAALEESGIPPQSLNIEVTETLAMSEPKTVLRILSQIRELGVRISLDDFGTGHSSLSRLRGFPLDVLKIDQAFVRGIEKNNEGREIARLIVTLGQHLHLKVIAEGVEVEEQKAYLMDFGCGFAQGYLYSAPIEADALQQLLGKPIAPSASVSTSSKIVMKETEFEVEVPTEQLAQKSVGAR
jgi:PAS domain S-box-containing protein